MSVRRRQNWLGQQRVDVPHLKSVESAVSNDFDELISGLVIGENKSYVVRGFEINMPGSIGSSANGLQLIVADSSILHGASNESGTFYNIPTGAPAEILSSTTNDRVEGAFTPSTDNYIGVEFVREVDDATVDQVYFWNPTTNVEITKTVPLALILDYKIVISTSSFASNVLPVAIVQTDASNNVISITDRRPLLLRLGTAGQSDPNPFYEFPWADGRAENFYTSTSSTSSPFQGGDKQIKNLKEFFDALMTEIKLLKGTPYWYSANAGSISNLRSDLSNTAFTGKGNVVHGRIDFQGIVSGMTTDVIIRTVDVGEVNNITLTQDGSDITTLIANHNAANPESQLELSSGDGSQIPTSDIVLTSKPGQINWSQDIFLRFIGGRLSYKITANDLSTEVSLSDNQVAYIELIRGEDVTPPLVFVNGGTVVTSVGNVSWTDDVEPGDFIKDASKGDEFYYQIDTVDSLSQVTLTVPFQEASSGPAGFDVKYAWGTYETNPLPSTARHIFIADREDVPFGEDFFWLFFRSDDGGSIPRVYARVLGGTELEQGEARTIADNTAQAVLDYVGSASESDATPTYDESAIDSKDNQTHYNSIAEENLTDRISKLTTMMADKAQDKTIQLVSDHTSVINTTNLTNQDITFAGGSGTANVIIPSSADNGTIGLSGTLSLAENEAAYYQIDRNASFSIADLSALTIANISDVPLDEKTFVFAYRLTGSNVYLWNNQVLLTGSSIALSVLRGYVQQNKTVKLVKGGTWSWDLLTNSLSNSVSAYIQVAGLAENVNEISAQSIVLDADGKCAYVALKRGAGASILTVNVDDIASVPQDDHTFIIARRTGNDVIVGTNSFALKDREFLELDGALAEINRYNGQLAVVPSATPDTRIHISGSDILKLSGSTITLEQKNLLLSFPGAIIDFATGKIFETNGMMPFNGGLNDFTPATIGANEYFYYSVSILPNTVNADNTISGQLLVIAANSSNAVLASAPKAPFPSSGIKLGNILVQEDGAGSILNIDYANILSLGVGGSGSGGTGDANELLERLKNHLDNGEFEAVTPNIFVSVEEELLDEIPTTAGFDIVSGTMKFSAAAEVVQSVQMVDSTFLSENKDITSAKLAAYWDLDNIDTAAIYQLSRDGGNEWQTVTMERIGGSDTYEGKHVFTEEASYNEAVEYAVSNADSTALVFDDTVLGRSQIFSISGYTVIKKLVAYLNVTGTIQGELTARIVRDDAGSPGTPSTDANDIVFQSNAVDLSTLAAGDNAVDIAITAPIEAGDYHIVYLTNLEYRNNYLMGVNEFAVRSDASAPTVPVSKNWDGTSYVDETEALVYRLEGRIIDLRVRIESSAGDKFLAGYGVFYDKDDTFAFADVGYKRQVIEFSGDDNINEFSITEFTPDPILMTVYEIGTGGAYRAGAFSVNGGTVSFPANTFNQPGDTITLEFLQVFSGSMQFDSTNRALLAENNLGSLDPSLDLSQPGLGVILRRPDGTLRMLTINDDDNIEIKTVP